jgi:TonB family protein
MNDPKCRKFFGGLLVLAVLAGLACAKKSQAPAADEKAVAGPAKVGEAAPAAGLKASAFELTLRILEGSRDRTSVPNRAVTSSFLEFLNFSNFETEEDKATEEQIVKVFSIKDLSLLTEAPLVWEKGKTGKAFHMFRINGQQYLVIVTPGRLTERNQFHIEVSEQTAAKKTSLLDTEFTLPDKTAAVFGFEDTQLKAYFITLRVARWLGEPAGPGAAAGGDAGKILTPTVVEAKGGAGSFSTPTVVDKVKPPKLIKEVRPVYPAAARKAGVEGVVILEATTDIYGRIASVKVLRGNPLLDQAAVDAVLQWVYEPMVINGKPRPVVFTVTLRFRLDYKKKPDVSGVAGGVEGGVQGGVEGGVEGGVAAVEDLKPSKGEVAAVEDLKQFEGDAVRAVGQVQPPKLVKQVDPVYPEEARKAGIEGVVILEAKADEQGNVMDARILRSVAPLDQAAVHAVKQWKYEPMIIDGKPRKVVFTVTVRFVLKDGGSAKALEGFAAGATIANKEIMPPKLIKEAAPVYPEAARAAGVQGVVILGVKTDGAGNVVDTIVLRSIPLLDQAAMDAVNQWVYEPFLKDGKAGPIVFTVTVRFQLR